MAGSAGLAREYAVLDGCVGAGARGWGLGQRECGAGCVQGRLRMAGVLAGRLAWVLRGWVRVGQWTGRVRWVDGRARVGHGFSVGLAGGRAKQC